jgi:hypothetical protein
VLETSLFYENMSILQVTNVVMVPQSSVDAYLISELGRKNMGEHLMPHQPHHGIEASIPKLAGLLQALNNVGCFRNNFAQFRGRLPSRVECRRYLRCGTPACLPVFRA